MAIYSYRAKKKLGEIAEGRIEAQSEKEAIEKLSHMGYLPTLIQLESSPIKPKPLYAAKPKGRIRAAEVTLFSRELASLLKSGVPILKALEIISEQSENHNFKNILDYIHDAVKDGTTFSSVLAQYPSVFPSLYVAMIRTGEDSGALPQALLRIADYRRKQEELLSRFRTALAYPILMAAVGLATIVFMLTFVMPRLMKIFVNMGQNLPLPTRMLIFASDKLRQYWFWIILVLAIAVLIFRREARTKTGKVSLSYFKLHIPIFGMFILKAELSRFSRTMELLIKNGIAILKAIEVSIPVLENEILKGILARSYKELEQGNSFGKSLKKSRLIPLFMSNLITVGEESGKLEEALGEVASSYEHDTDDAIRVMSSLLEPIMILAMGLIVGFIVVAMLLPIFEINVIAR